MIAPADTVAATGRLTFSAPDAPTTAGELAEALDCSRQNIATRALREHRDNPRLWKRHIADKQIWELSVLPEDVRAALKRFRDRLTAAAARDLVKSASDILYQFPIAVSEFTEREKQIGEERRDFLCEVERLVLDNPNWTYERAIEHIARREMNAARRHDGSLRYKRLLVDGQRFEPALNVDNFKNWKTRWAKWRSGPLDTSNWQCLCDLYGFRKQIDDQGRESYVRVAVARKGDGRFWALLGALYETPQRRPLIACYELAIKQAKEARIAEGEIPTLRQVRYHYTQHADARGVEGRRAGAKFVYDELSAHVVRNWRKLQPNQVWSGDHHNIRVACTYFDPLAGGGQGGWRLCTPWLTNWIDVSSWFEVGHFITEKPSRDSIEIALKIGVENQRGAPRGLAFDNGKDYTSFAGGKDLGYDPARAETVCDQLAIRQRHFALPGNPRCKLNERDYRIVQDRWERNWFSFMGANKRELDGLWDYKNPYDGFTLRDRLARYPKNHALAGCLVRPELLPTFEDVRKSYAKWRAAERHHMVSRGRICPGESPAMRFARVADTPMLRPLTVDEISIGFLRPLDRLALVKRGGSIQYTPKGGTAADTITYRSAALFPFIRERVQARIDIHFNPPRLFVFEAVESGAEKHPTWRMIKCHGPSGSVPHLLNPDAYPDDASPNPDSAQELRRQLAAHRKDERDLQRGQDVELRRDAEQSVARSLGVEPARAPHDPAVARAVRRFSAESTQRRKIVAELVEEEVSDDARKRYLYGDGEPSGSQEVTP